MAATGVVCAAISVVLAGGATGAGTGSASARVSSVTGPGGRKVMLVVEENHEYGQIIGSSYAPRITSFAHRFGLAARMDAGYPPSCPSLPAYLILTSGSRYGICDDAGPTSHQITAANLYQQVAQAGMTYRQYSESMPQPCAARNSSDQRYLVRHAPTPYYVSEQQRCPQWDVALGTLTAGALHQAVQSGTLPAFSFVTPDACHDMHGAAVCGSSSSQLISAGDTWLGHWLDQIMAGKDYTSGHLTVIVTWDEGSTTSNHIPTIVISPKTAGVQSATAYTHCSTLRTIEDVLGLKPLGCAASATSMITAFHLG